MEVEIKILFRYLHAGTKEEKQYSSYSFVTSALDGVSGQRHGPAALYPRYAGDRRLGGTLNLPRHGGWRKNALPLPGIEPSCKYT
jgi:hypothetical protein